jgi:hypothetical protein
MPQFGLLLILVLLPLQMLSGSSTPQATLFRGAGFDLVWPQFVALAVIGAALFGDALAPFRLTIGTMGDRVRRAAQDLDLPPARACRRRLGAKLGIRTVHTIATGWPN